MNYFFKIFLIVCIFSSSNLMPSHEDAGIPAWIRDMNRLMREAEDPRYQEPVRPARRLGPIGPPAQRRLPYGTFNRLSILTPAQQAQREQAELAEKERIAESLAQPLQTPSSAPVTDRDLRSAHALHDRLLAAAETFTQARAQEQQQAQTLARDLRAINNQATPEAIYSILEQDLMQASTLGRELLFNRDVVNALHHIIRIVRPVVFENVIKHFDGTGQQDIARSLRTIRDIARPRSILLIRSQRQQTSPQPAQRILPALSQEHKSAIIQSTIDKMESAIRAHRQRQEAGPNRTPAEILRDDLLSVEPNTPIEIIIIYLEEALKIMPDILDNLFVVDALRHVYRTINPSDYKKIINHFKKSQTISSRLESAQKKKLWTTPDND